MEELVELSLYPHPVLASSPSTHPLQMSVLDIFRRATWSTSWTNNFKNHFTAMKYTEW